MEGLFDRLSEMIAVAEETRDAALILQAFELSRSLGAEEAVLSRLVSDAAQPLAAHQPLRPRRTSRRREPGRRARLQHRALMAAACALV